MIKKESIKNGDVAGAVRMGRRRFIGSLGAAAGSLGALGHIVSRTSASTAVPMPTYIPEGYSLLGVYRGEPDGFRTGNAEIKFAYLNPTVIQHHIYAPLFVFVSPMTDNFFGGTENHTPELLKLQIGDETVQAKYFDGCWRQAPNGETILPNGTRVTWNTRNLNSLVFPFDGYMIGIVGSKQGGVGRAELMKMASSFGPVTN